MTVCLACTLAAHQTPLSSPPRTRTFNFSRSALGVPNCVFRACAKKKKKDVIILPEEAVYKKVDTGREGERVYLMEIAGNRRFFYWMQDKDADKDEVW